MRLELDSGSSPGHKASSRDAILDAAEVLLGRHGPDGVSLRQISVASGSANHSAVQYHFNNRDGLIRSIFERRIPSLEKCREDMLQRIDREGAIQDTRRLLEVLLRPIADEKDGAGRCSYAAFLLGLQTFGDLSLWDRYNSASAPFTLRLNELLRDSLQFLPADVFTIRLMSSISLFLASVVDWDRRETAGAPPLCPLRDDYLRHIIDYAAAGMTAPYRETR